MNRVWLHNIKTLAYLQLQIDAVRREHGEDAVIEIQTCGYGRICLDVLPPEPAKPCDG